MLATHELVLGRSPAGTGDTGGLAFGRWGTGEAALSAQLPAPGVLAMGWALPHGALSPVESIG